MGSGSAPVFHVIASGGSQDRDGVGDCRPEPLPLLVPSPPILVSPLLLLLYFSSRLDIASPANIFAERARVDAGVCEEPGGKGAIVVVGMVMVTVMVVLVAGDGILIVEIVLVVLTS